MSAPARSAQPASPPHQKIRWRRRSREQQGLSLVQPEVMVEALEKTKPTGNIIFSQNGRTDERLIMFEVGALCLVNVHVSCVIRMWIGPA